MPYFLIEINRKFIDYEVMHYIEWIDTLSLCTIG
jgi:hypothetical protein